jgi:glutathione S-transferase
VFVTHLAQLDIIEKYASRVGPYLTGKVPCVADVLLFPLFVFYESYFRRLRKVLWEGRPKVHAWWLHMSSVDTVKSVVEDMHRSIRSINE